MKIKLVGFSLKNSPDSPEGHSRMLLAGIQEKDADLDSRQQHAGMTTMAGFCGFELGVGLIGIAGVRNDNKGSVTQF